MTFSSSRHHKRLLTLVAIVLLANNYSIKSTEALWWFSNLTNNNSNNSNQTAVAQLIEVTQETQTQQEQTKSVADSRQVVQQVVVDESPFTIAGIRPSSIATLLNTVSETGFEYFNVHDQCRSRTACDVGFMLYKRLNFIHNWIIRASVRTLVDGNNIYAQSWQNGMAGRNCTLVYPACNQSPIESIMNFALLAA